MAVTDEPALTARCTADTRAWEFLIDTSKVSFDSMAVFTSGTLATWPRQNSQPRPGQPPLNSGSA